MPKAILGKKLGMTQVFSPEGKLIPVTVITAGPCLVAQVKTAENDGYTALQLGYGKIKAAKVNKPVAGHCQTAGIEPQRYFREVKVDDTAAYQVGQTLTVEQFASGEKVDISGISKGKGFAGTIKRWNDKRGPSSHGSKSHRRPASAGAKGPARVFKGKHSPGQLGHEKVTIQNLEIIRVDSERDLILVKGAVPGPKEGLLLIKGAIKSA
ncbi:MAG: 50S ribosomal protein L3 [Clostridiales bacterium]|nr:50S ribosomal protein L3 [Clostridiales bacterium]